MDKDALLMEIHMLVAIITKTTLNALEQRLSKEDSNVSGLQFGVMHALCHKKQTITELSERFLLDPSTLVPAVDALERKGFVIRGRDPKDRRRIPLTLTQRGCTFIERIPFMDSDDPLVQALDGLGPEDSQRLLALLRKLVRHMPEGEEILTNVSQRVCLQLRQEAVDIDKAQLQGPQKQNFESR